MSNSSRRHRSRKSRKGISAQKEKPPWRKINGAAAALTAGAALVAITNGASPWVTTPLTRGSALVLKPTLVNPMEACDNGNGWVVSARSASPPPEDTGSQSTASNTTWANANRAVAASPLRLSIIATSRTPETLIVTAITPINVTSEEVSNQSRLHYFEMPGCGGGPVSQIFIGVDLSTATHRTMNLEDQALRNPFPRQLSQSSPDDYELYIYSPDRTYTFDLEVKWQVNGVEHSEVLSNNGHHYSVTSSTGATEMARAYWAGGQWLPTKQPQDPTINPFGVDHPKAWVPN